MSRIVSLLLMLLLAGAGVPFDAAFAASPAAPAEDDDCVETIKIASPQDRQREPQPRTIRRAQRATIPGRSHRPNSPQSLFVSATTTFLIAVQLPLVC